MGPKARIRHPNERLSNITQTPVMCRISTKHILRHVKQHKEPALWNKRWRRRRQDFLVYYTCISKNVT